MAEENKIFTVEIITPDRIFYKGEGDMIELQLLLVRLVYTRNTFR